MHRRSIHHRHQRGVSLVISLVILAALGLMAAWAVKSGSADVRVVGNMQARQQVLAAARAALESTISNAQFSQQPATVAARAIPIDIDGDGVPDASATLSPQPACFRVRYVKQSSLEANNASDLPCMRSSAISHSGIDSGTASNDDSLCSDSEWNLRAVVTDPATGASIAVNQGVAIRGLSTDTANGCP